MPFCVTSLLGDNDALRGHAYYFPVSLKQDAQAEATPLFATTEQFAPTIVSNLSAGAHTYLKGLAVNEGDVPALLWNHVVAIGYSPAYLLENGDGIRRDWPRITLPTMKNVLVSSATLGAQLASLLDTDEPVAGVTTHPRVELKAIANVSTVDGKPPNIPEDLAVTVGWGHKGQGNTTMPGKGKISERDYTTKEREALAEGAEVLGLTLEQALAQLGETTCDVYLNEHAYWKNIPTRVWEYTIGGYQVIKKWLSYRENNRLGRAISPDEAHYVRDMARRIGAICLLQPQLDANYASVKANAYDWPQPTEGEAETAIRASGGA